ncbi:hypothetical protein CU097_000134, partial [Rhizopus azygosporus]
STRIGVPIEIPSGNDHNELSEEPKYGGSKLVKPTGNKMKEKLKSLGSYMSHLFTPSSSNNNTKRHYIDIDLDYSDDDKRSPPPDSTSTAKRKASSIQPDDVIVLIKRPRKSYKPKMEEEVEVDELPDEYLEDQKQKSYTPKKSKEQPLFDKKELPKRKTRSSSAAEDKTSVEIDVEDNNELTKRDFTFYGRDKHILMYPFVGSGQITVYWDDLQRLAKDRFLNDTIIDFYPRVWADQYPDDGIYTFNSFFYTKLVDCKTTEHFEKLSRWTQNANIFDKDLLIIPVAEHSHWFIILVVNPGASIGQGKRIDQDELRTKSSKDRLDRTKPYIMTMDSLGGSQRHIRRYIVEYLKKEAARKLDVLEPEFIPPEFMSIQCPQQDNHYDCGVFCLHSIYNFYKYKTKMWDSIFTTKSTVAVEEFVENQKKELLTFRRFLYTLLENKAKEYSQFKRSTTTS